MITFKDYLLLTEVTIDQIKERTKEFKPEFFKHHDQNAEHRTKDAIIDHFSAGNKPEHVPWIISQYKKQHFKQEDAPRVSGILKSFEKNKPRLENKDINSYTLSNNEPNKLNINHHLDKLKEHDTQFPDGSRWEGHPEAKKMYDHEGLTVHRLDSHEAARSYRKSCNHDDESGGWCTGWKTPEHFENYHEMGPIYSIQTPDNKKHQIHFATGQFMDKHDDYVDAEDFAEKHPKIKEVPFRMQSNMHHEESDDDQEHLETLKYHLSSDIAKKHRIEDAFNSADHYRMSYYADNHHDDIPSHIIHQAIEYHGDGRVQGSVIGKLSQSRNFKQDHIDEIFKHADFGLRKQFIDRTTNSEHFKSMLSDINDGKLDYATNTHLISVLQRKHFDNTGSLIPVRPAHELKHMYRNLNHHQAEYHKQMIDRAKETWGNNTIQKYNLEWNQKMFDHYSGK